MNTTSKNNQIGYVMLFSILITAIILSIIIGIANVSFRQQIFTRQVTDSTRAFYAAETALDCIKALDERGDFGNAPSSTGGPTPSIDMYCDGSTVLTSNYYTVLPGGEWVYEYNTDGPATGLEVSPDNFSAGTTSDSPMCARAKITKYIDTGNQLFGLQVYNHIIEVWGYNISCIDLDAHFDAINPASGTPTISPVANKIVERSLKYTYQTEE